MLDNLVGSEDAVYQNFKKELETIIMKRCLKNGFNFG